MQWIKQGRFFQLPDPASDDWRHSHTQLPVVDTLSNQRWRIYYSSRNHDSVSLPCWVEVEAANPGHVLAQNTGPLLAPGGADDFDQHGVMPTAVLHRDNRILMYYIGWSRQQDVPYRNAIGLAISEDGGLHFVKYDHNPLFPRDEIDPIFTGTLHVVADAGSYHGYYMSCSEWRDCDGRLEPRYRLKYARSSDGIHWQRGGDIAIDYRDDHEGGIVAASVIRHAGRFHMWYCYRRDRDFRSNRENSYRLGYAFSENARDWTRLDSLAGIDISESGWDSEMLAYPAVVKFESRAFLFYNGNGFGQSGIGYAIGELDPIT